MAISESAVAPSNATLFTPVSDGEIEWAWGSGGAAESVYWRSFSLSRPYPLLPFAFAQTDSNSKPFTATTTTTYRLKLN